LDSLSHSARSPSDKKGLRICDGEVTHRFTRLYVRWCGDGRTRKAGVTPVTKRQKEGIPLPHLAMIGQRRLARTSGSATADPSFSLTGHNDKDQTAGTMFDFTILINIQLWRAFQAIEPLLYSMIAYAGSIPWPYRSTLARSAVAVALMSPENRALPDTIMFAPA
jgi:hypothetical protein